MITESHFLLNTNLDKGFQIISWFLSLSFFLDLQVTLSGSEIIMSKNLYVGNNVVGY